MLTIQPTQADRTRFVCALHKKRLTIYRDLLIAKLLPLYRSFNSNLLSLILYRKVSRSGVRIVIRRAVHIAMDKRVLIQLAATRLLICAVCAKMLAACASNDPSSAFRHAARSPVDLSCRIVASCYPDDARQDGKGGAGRCEFQC